MIRLLRHDDSVPREDDGAVKILDLASTFRSELTPPSHWSVRTWLRFSQGGGGIKKIPICAWIPVHLKLFCTFEQFKAILEGNTLILRCKATMLVPNDFAELICHVVSSHDLHSIIQSGLILDGKDIKKEACGVFCTAENQMSVDQYEEVEFDLTKPRIATYIKQLVIKRDHPVLHYTRGVHREGGEHEVKEEVYTVL